MLRYNRARRAEWVEAQKKLESDELASARLAYLTGNATEEQVALVEAANREAEEKGIRLPPLIAPPEHRTHFEENIKPALQGAEANNEAAATGKGVFGVVSGLFGGSGSSKDTAAVSASESAAQQAGSAAESVGSKAKSAWDRELENQRNGGSLDQIGLASAGAPASTKKGWWPF